MAGGVWWGACMAGGACVVGPCMGWEGMHGRGCVVGAWMGGRHAWQEVCGGGMDGWGACMAGGVWWGAMRGLGGHAWQGVCGGGHAWQGGMHGRGCVVGAWIGGGHAWQGVCGGGPCMGWEGMHGRGCVVGAWMGGGHAWQGVCGRGMHGGGYECHACLRNTTRYGRSMRGAVRILLECILVQSFICSVQIFAYSFNTIIQS